MQQIEKVNDPFLTPTENAELKPFPWLFWTVLIFNISVCILGIFLLYRNPEYVGMILAQLNISG